MSFSEEKKVDKLNAKGIVKKRLHGKEFEDDRSKQIPSVYIYTIWLSSRNNFLTFLSPVS